MCLAVPGKILSIDASDPLTRMARVDFGGVARQVSLACVPEAVVGQYALVHAGFAITVIDEDEAAETLDYLRQLGQIAETGDGEA